MTTADLVKEISKRTGYPEAIVRVSVFDFSRDIHAVVTTKSTGGFSIPNVGYMAVSVDKLESHLRKQVILIENSFRKDYKLLEMGGELARVMLTKAIDDFYASVTLLLENQLIKNEEYKRGAGKKKTIDGGLLNEYFVRVDSVLDQLPTTLRRKEYSEIQNICVQRLCKQGILQGPRVKDCQVQPVPVCVKGKDVLHAV